MRAMVLHHWASRLEVNRCRLQQPQQDGLHERAPVRQLFLGADLNDAAKQSKPDERASGGGGPPPLPRGRGPRKLSPGPPPPRSQHPPRASAPPPPPPPSWARQGEPPR